MQAPLRKTALSVALLAAGLAMSAMAQTPGTSTPGTTGKPAATTGSSASGSTMSTDKSAARGASDAKLAHGDKKFVEEAARGGMAEVQLGQLAAQKAQSAEVKQFGQKMADDHGKANEQLKQIASGKNVQLPTDLDGSHKREYDRLSKLSGADFDREYMKHMVDDHKKDVKEFSNEAKSGKDPDIKQFAASTLPTLQQHLQLAQQTDASVRTASRNTNTARTSGSGNSGMTSGGTTSSGATPGWIHGGGTLVARQA